MARGFNYYERPVMEDSPLIEDALIRANDQILNIGMPFLKRGDDESLEQPKRYPMTIEHVYCCQSQHSGD
jgi:hypothetical protein